MRRCAGLRRSAAALAAAWLSLTAHAQPQQLIPGYPADVKAFDPRDTALLPPYCKYTQEFEHRVRGGDNVTEAARWKATIGPQFLHLHHYCYGLMMANRGLLLARTDFARKYYLGDAIREFTYVIERADDKYVLLPEMLSRRGQAELRLGYTAQGLQSIERAIALKPDYWLPYAHAADFYHRQGEVTKAREWLVRGLEKTDQAPALRSRLDKLDSGSSSRSARTAER